MRRIMTAWCVAVALTASVSHVHPAAQGGGGITVAVHGLPAGASLSIAINGGKIGESTTSATPTDGDVTFALNLGNVVKGDNVRADVYVAECPNEQVKLSFVEQGLPEPSADGCTNRRKLGVIVWWSTTRVTINYPNGLSTGMSTTTKMLIGGGIGAAAAGIFAATSGGDGGDSTTPGTSPSPSSPATNFQGRYAGSGTVTVNTCAFSATTIISAQLTVTDNNTATITWTKTHTNAGVTFTFTGVHLNVSSATQAAFTATTSQAVGGANYTVNDNASINNASLTLTQTFTRADGVCTVVYQMTLTRQ